MKKRRKSIIISCTNLVLPILLTLGLYIIIHGHFDKSKPIIHGTHSITILEKIF